MWNPFKIKTEEEKYYNNLPEQGTLEYQSEAANEWDEVLRDEEAEKDQTRNQDGECRPRPNLFRGYGRGREERVCKGSSFA